jgi:hypothetical protein
MVLWSLKIEEVNNNGGKRVIEIIDIKFSVDVFWEQKKKPTAFNVIKMSLLLQVGAAAGVYDVLDSLDFRGLDNPPNVHYRTRQQRWTGRYPDIPFYGQYV